MPIPGFLLAIFESKFANFLKSIPWQVWLVILGVAALIGAVIWHGHVEKKFGDARYTAGYNQAVADIKAAEAKKVAPLVKAKTAADAKSAAVNKGVEKTYNDQAAHIDAAADALRLRWGARPQRRADSLAVSGVHDVPGAAAAPEQSVGGPGQVDAGLAQPDTTIEVPKLELIARAQSCDLDHAALKAWNIWYDQNKKIHDDWVAKGPAAQPL